MSLVDKIVHLYERAATDLPKDVEIALEKAEKAEGSALAAGVLSTILHNARIARKNKVPICQDTGVPVFRVSYPESRCSKKSICDAIVQATKIATKRVPLRPNAVDPITGRNSGNNVGIEFPVIYLEQNNGNELQIDLMLKGGGSENVGRIYSLPNADLKADRDLDGVRRCIIDCALSAQGRGCPPGIIGVGIAGIQDVAMSLAKCQLFRKIEDKNKNKKLASLEDGLLRDVNELGIGPMGFGGKTTALAVKVGYAHRHPASFFVAVAYMCWACRRHTLRIRL